MQSLNTCHIDLISIHALREESDVGIVHFVDLPHVFQSTLSVRRATVDLLIWLFL